MRDLDYRERSSRRGNEERAADRIIDPDEWPKFDQRGDRPCWTTRRTGSSLPGKFSRTHVVRVAPGAPLLPPSSPLVFFLGSLFMYLLPFFGALGFFSYPLAGHLPLRKGRLRCRIRGEGLGQSRGRRIRAR